MKGGQTTKDGQGQVGLFMDSREELSGAEMRQQQHTWALLLELDGAAIPWNTSIKEYQRGRLVYISEALEQPLLLPKGMEDLRHVRQLDLLMSLKRDLAMVSSSS